jgi:FkbM family methyltransferase
MIRSTAASWPPPRYLRKFHRRLLELRQLLVRDIEVVDGPAAYRFRCESVREFNRCLKLFSKEPGTVAWIASMVKEGEIFYDIGANIGVYTLLAARKVGPQGKVYAFEPHAANFARLIEHVIRNRLQDVVIPCNAALDAEEGFSSFLYDSADAGTSNSQFVQASGGATQASGGGIAELKYATTIDRLIGAVGISPPHHVKIDVDGNEHLILKGMAGLLGSSAAPASLQVELNEPHAAAIKSFLIEHRYELVETHRTRSAERRLKETGESAGGSNAVFRKAA